MEHYLLVSKLAVDLSEQMDCAQSGKFYIADHGTSLLGMLTTDYSYSAILISRAVLFRFMAHLC
jgi:hypothetical protein